jgi:hypothetical protein
MFSGALFFQSVSTWCACLSFVVPQASQACQINFLA